MTRVAALRRARLLLGPNADVTTFRDLGHVVGVRDTWGLRAIHVWGSGTSWEAALNEAAVRVGVPGAAQGDK